MNWGGNCVRALGRDPFYSRPRLTKPWDDVHMPAPGKIARKKKTCCVRGQCSPQDNNAQEPATLTKPRQPDGKARMPLQLSLVSSRGENRVHGTWCTAAGDS